MLQPFLIIGLGGSGGKTLQTLRDDLERLLRQRGWEGGLPAAWQLLQIDVPPTPGEVDPDLPAPMSGDSYLGLTKANVGFDAIDHDLQNKLAHNRLAQHAMAGWRPRSTSVNVAVEKGAGQYRAIGRILAVTYISSIKEGIDQAISRMRGVSAESELRQVAKLLGHRDKGPIPDPVSIVVTSIAGGTGAGLVVDVCDILRLSGHGWAGDSYGVLYTPEVFDELPPAARQGVRPNAFAALSEILAGFWDKDGFGDDESALLQMAGVPTSGTLRLGPRYPILVGQSNGSVRLSSQNDVYRAMGRALSAWVLSESIQSSMSNYLSGNWAATASGPDAIPFKEQSSIDRQENPFQSIGFARVSLGRDRFLQYSSQYLARKTTLRLREGHLEDKSHDDHRSDESILQEWVEKSWDTFLSASGLDLNQEQVDHEGHHRKLLENIRSREQISEQRQAWVSKVHSVVENASGVDGIDAETARALIQGEIRNRNEASVRQYVEMVHEGIREWTERVPDDLVRLSLQTAAQAGLPVTIELLRKLSDHLPTVARHISATAESRRHTAVAVEDFPAGGITLPANAPEIESYIQGHVGTALARADAVALDDIAELLREARNELVQALSGELENLLAELKAETSRFGAGRTPEFESWPQDDSVPRRLLPTQNERLLLNPEDFHATLLGKLRDQLEARTTDEAENGAIRAIVLNPLDRTDRYHRDNLLQRAWVPQRTDFRPGRGLSAKSSSLRLELSLTPSSILEQSEAWLKQEDTPIGRFVGENLDGYLNDQVESKQLEERLAKFGGELAAAIRASAPLVSVNSAVATVVHPGLDMEPQRFFSGFPFSPGSKAGKITDEVLHHAAGMSPDARKKLLGAEAKEPHVDVFSTLSAPMEAAVFDSLMRPMAEEWNKASAGGPDAMSRFWRFRRSRPLPQFIPMSPFVRQAMVRGWFTANLLNQIGSASDGTLTIYVPQAGERVGEYFEFPNPLLLPAGYEVSDRLAGVLKTALAALIQVNATAKIDPVRSYERLHSLGSTKTGAIQTYDQLNKELGDWIEHARLPAGAPEPITEWVGNKTDSPEQRQKAVLTQLENWARGYESEIFAPVESMGDLGDVPRAWELRRDYEGALKDLYDAVGKMNFSQVRRGLV